MAFLSFSKRFWKSFQGFQPTERRRSHATAPLSCPGPDHPPVSSKDTGPPFRPPHRHPLQPSAPTYLGPLICLPNSQPKLLSQLLTKLSYTFILGRQDTGGRVRLPRFLQLCSDTVAFEVAAASLCYRPGSKAPGGDTGCPSHLASAWWGWGQEPMLEFILSLWGGRRSNSCF